MYVKPLRLALDSCSFYDLERAALGIHYARHHCRATVDLGKPAIYAPSPTDRPRIAKFSGPTITYERAALHAGFVGNYRLL